MISKEQATECLQEVARDLLGMSYGDLVALTQRLPSSPDDEWRELQQVTVDGETLYIYVLMGTWGLFRRRISVVTLQPSAMAWPGRGGRFPVVR